MYKSLEKEIIIKSSSLIVIVGLCIGFIYYFHSLQQAEKEFFKNSDNSFQNIGETLTMHLWAFDQEAIQNFSNSIIDSKIVAGVLVTGHDKAVIFKKGTFSGKNLYRQTKNIRYQDQFIGNITITYSKLPLIEKRRNIISITALLVLFIIVAMIPLIQLLISKHLFRPLKMVSAEMDKVAEGEYDTSLPIGLKTEIQPIVNAFTHLTQNLIEREKEVAEKTESLESEIEIRKKTEDRFRMLYEDAPLPYQSLDFDGCILDVNQAWLETMGGYTKDAVLGLSFGEFIHPDWIENFLLNFPRFKIKGEVRGVEFSLIKKDGSTILIQLNGKIAYDEDGNFEQTHCIFQDITRQRLSEDNIRKSEERWHRTFNAFTDIVSIMDKNLKIVRMNQAGLDALGLTIENVIGRHCHEIFQDSEVPCSGCPLPEVKKDFQPYSKEMHHEKMGKTFLVSVAPVPDESGDLEYIAHVAKDITDLKNLEEELGQAQKMEAIGTLAGGIAHDFNNILSVIIGFSEMAKVEIEEGKSPAEDINQILNAGERGAALVKQILTFSRKVGHYRQPLQPHLIIKEALKMLRSSLPTTIQIEENIDPDCGFISADPTHIHQVMMNLCTNALHAIEDEKGTISVRLEKQDITAEEITDADVTPGPFVILSVTDSGTGMDQKTKDRIFEPYFTTKNPSKGTGLGLSVIFGIVKDLNGFIKVESAPGKGSSFHIYIPSKVEEPETNDTSAGELKLPTGNERIMIIDDEPPIVTIQQSILQRLGYKVTAMTDCQKALQTITSDPDQFDLIITDQTMPTLSGAELAQKVLKIKPEMPIILCTGYSTILSEEKALEIGIKKFLKKPIAKGQLAKCVREVLDNG